MISMSPIGVVKNIRKEVEDDNWGDVVSVIELDATFGEEALLEIENFSHAEIYFYFHLVEEIKIEIGARHPRNNKEWPKVGIFAQRGKNRPNCLGATTVKLLKREGRQLFVQGLDAVDGTPILDIKPVIKGISSTGSSDTTRVGNGIDEKLLEGERRLKCNIENWDGQDGKSHRSASGHGPSAAHGAQWTIVIRCRHCTRRSIMA